jgi:hypothetical protein
MSRSCYPKTDTFDPCSFENKAIIRKKESVLCRIALFKVILATRE